MEEVQYLINREPAPSVEIENTVKNILKDIKANGEDAVISYAKKFDNLGEHNLKISQEELDEAAEKVDPKVKAAINGAIKKVKDFHLHQAEKSWSFEGKEGETLGQRIRPLKRVGVYVPGGSGIYPSTVIMNVVPAKVAGVEDIAAVTPVLGELESGVAFALKKLGVTEVYRIGGAQAVGMLAYGAGECKPVDKIVGPANVYAALAKKEVFGTCDIDMIAGPSEILVMCDETADPDWVAADLLSQAEHGSGFEAAICITNSEKMAYWVSDFVRQQVESSPKKELLEETLEQYGRILVVDDWDDGVEICDAIAAEHLEIITENAKKLSKQVQNAGAIFIGAYSSEPVGDYFAGPNHVLPTNRTARFASPLGVYDFIKRTSIIEYNSKAMQKNGPLIAELADYEGFFHHAEAIRKRL